jgi:hypothetical protein
MLKGIFGPKRKEVTGGSRKVIKINKEEMGGTCSTRERDGEWRAKYCRKTKERDHLGDPDVIGRMP